MAVPWPTQQNLVIAFSFLGFVLVNIPLYWHLEAWNIGCIMYIFWSGSQCLIQFINCIIWKNNVINWAPVWCDITSRWRLASSIGICVSSLIINRRLYKIASVSAVSVTNVDKRRMIMIDLSIGLIPPILVVALYWFIQGHRFDIYEGYGCIYEIPNTILSYFLYTAWPIVIGLISMVYCSMTLRAFLKRRKQFNELMSSNRNLTFNRYLRLMGLASIEMLCTVPLSVWALTQQAAEPLYVWQGLGNLHYDFHRVGQYPSIEWRTVPSIVRAINFDLWNIISCALLFFAFFGCAEEARRHYHIALTSVAKRVGVTTGLLERTGFNSSSGYSVSKPTMSGIGRITIPTFAQRRTRRDSMSSFSDRLSSSISIGDVTPVDDLKVPYSASEHSAGSSTYFPSPIDQKSSEKLEHIVQSPVIVQPEPIYDATAVARPTPDAPAPVRPDSMDMV
ncbi:hypothetical protein AcV7_010103 [Taiwanofungus camphoratus]|nr:hypothetical protein AcV7_010103 [Antrodia cinnamomea]